MEEMCDLRETNELVENFMQGVFVSNEGVNKKPYLLWISMIALGARLLIASGAMDKEKIKNFIDFMLES